MVNPLLIKSGSIILGGGTATAGGVTCVVYRQEIQKFLDKQFSGTKNTSGSSAFVIIKTKTANNESATKVLYEADGSKNFNCVLNGSKTTDDSCDIFLINENAEKKANNLDDLKNSNAKAKKENIKDNTFFKLTIKDDLLKDITWDGTQTIDIVSKTEADSGTNKKYGSFTLQYKVLENNKDITVSGKTNWIIGKISSEDKSNNLSSIDNLTCQIKDETGATKESCAIFKIDQTVNNLKDIVSSNIKVATVNKDDYAKNQYFVVDLKKTAKKEISDFNNKTVIVAESNNTEVAQFSFVSALLDDGVFSTTTSKTIILS